MAKIDGNLFRIKLEGVLLGGTTSNSIAFSKDLQEVTTQDSFGNTEYHSTCGKIAAKGSFDGFYDPDAVLNAEEIIDNINNKSGLVTIQIGVSAGTYWEFEAMLSDLSIETKNDSVPTIKGSFASSGTLTKHSAIDAPLLLTAVILALPAKTIIATFDKDMIDPASYTADFVVHVDAGTPSVTVTRDSGNLKQYIIVVSGTVTNASVVTLSITSGNIKSVAGGTLATVTNFAVTNLI